MCLCIHNLYATRPVEVATSVVHEETAIAERAFDPKDSTDVGTATSAPTVECRETDLARFRQCIERASAKPFDDLLKERRAVLGVLNKSFHSKGQCCVSAIKWALTLIIMWLIIVAYTQYVNREGVCVIQKWPRHQQDAA